MVRSSPQQISALGALPVVQVIAQDKLAAQDTFTAANVTFLPAGNVPIMPMALGGALGMAVVNAEMRAEARRFADTHVQPLQSALQGFDASAALGDSLRHGLAAQPVHFAGVTTGETLPAVSGTRLVLHTTYSMTPDFSALQVTADASVLPASGGDGRPLYHNVLTYQSARLVPSPKSAADRQRMIAAENSRYEALRVGDEIDQANAEIADRDPRVAHLREKIGRQQLEHKHRLASAKAPVWDADTRAQRLVEMWSIDRGSALKVAMRDSGAEIAHMLQLDLDQPATDDKIMQPRAVFKDGSREIDYVRGGRMISLAVGDTDGGLKKPKAPVMVPAPVVGVR